MAYYALIMAGGGGTRLWPLSRRSQPKQALELVGERTMFQHAVDRVAPLFGPQGILVVTGEEYVEQLREQAPDIPPENFVVEPMGRGTAPAIGLGGIHILRRDPEAVMAVLTADHFIRDVERFRRALTAARQVAEEDHLVTLGIEPGFPSTGYGYIEQGEQLETRDGFPVFRARRFTEKPDRETAERMVASGRYAWNSGMFVWRVSRVMEEFEQQMPDTYDKLERIASALGSEKYSPLLRREWPTMERQTIDYGVMEGAENVAVIPVDIGWSDVGNWSSMRDILPADEAGNVIVGDHLGVDTHNSLVFNDGERLVVTIGLEDMIVVNTGNAVLVCPRRHEQSVREVVKRLRGMGREDVL